MTDNEQCKLLEKFINDSTIAHDIKVTITEHSTDMKPKPPAMTMRYEDTELLSSILRGAMHFCYWLRRNNYTLFLTKEKPLPKTFGKVKITKKLKDFEKKFNRAKITELTKRIIKEY